MSKKEKDLVPADNPNSDASPGSVNVEVKKRGGCGTFLMGFIFAFVLMLVVVVGAGLYLYYNMSIQKVENMLGVTIPIEGDVKNLALKDLLAKTDQLVNVTLDTLNTEFKVELPETIPGTSLSLKETYDEQITFLGETKKVKEFRIQDIVNNLSDFVDAVLPKLYDHITVGQLLDTAGTTITSDLDYPALVDAFYNVGTEAEPELKTLSELTINQALDKVPEYFGSENLTVQMALDALGAEWLPKPAEGETDIYADLRALKISDLNVENLTEKVTGEVLLKMVDLSGYEFLNTDEFKATKIKDLGTFIAGLELGEFVELSTVVTGSEIEINSYFAKSQYKNLDKTLKLSKLKSTVLGLKINQIFNEIDVAKITSYYSEAAAEETIGEFLARTSGATFEQLTDSQIDCASYGGYVALIANSTAATYEENINNANIQDLLGGADLVSPIAKLCELKISDIKDSDNAVDTILAEFGTLGELVGGSTGGIFEIIADVTIQDLLDHPAEAINEKLKASSKTLETLLGSVPDDANEIIKTVMGITVGQLFTSGSTAITDAISTKTLGELMNLTDETGFVSLLANVSFGDLMGDGATAAIKNALTTQDGAEVTLGEFLEIDTSTASGILVKMSNIKMSQLLGNSTTTADPSGAIQSVVNSLTLTDVFGGYDSQTSAILKELYDMTPDDKGSILVGDVFSKINDIKLSTVVGSSKPAVLNLIANYDTLTLGTIGDMTVKEGLTVQDLIDAGLVDGSDLEQEVKDMTIADAVNRINEVVKSTKSD